MSLLYIVVPCYNEEEALPLTAPVLAAKLETLISAGLAGGDSRILLVDDGSKDGTWGVIRGLYEADKRFAALRLSRNRGHQNALLAGLEYAAAHGHRGICSESEWGPIKRDIELVKETGCAYHVCHISTKESVDLIRKAKAEGVDITCETGPHSLVMNDGMLKEEGRFKMNPPIRSEEDRLALVEGIMDGTIDMIATDHAPHSKEEKSRGLEGSLMGVVGLETAFPVLYTEFVMSGMMSIEHLMDLMSRNPRERFSIPLTQDICVWSWH